MHAMEQEAVWDAMESGSWEGGGWNRELFEACLYRSRTIAHSPVPIERKLLTTGLTAAGVESLYQGQVRLETPHLDVRYQQPAESLFWRG